jgi:hypothetical protein
VSCIEQVYDGGMAVVDCEARERVTVRLEGELGSLCGVANVTAARMVEAIAEALATGAWEGWGIRSPEHWVTWKCGVSSRRARVLVGIARRWAELPATMAAFGEGRLSEDQVAVVCRYIPAWADGEVAELATMATVPQLVRALAKYAWADTSDTEPEPAQPVEEERRVGFFFDDDGSWRASIHLPADEGAVLESALAAARDRVFQQRKADGSATHVHEVTWADALAELADAYLGGRVTQRAHRDRYMTLLHVEVGADGEPQARVHLGPRLPDSLRRYLTCDGHIKAIFEVGGVAVNVGRAQRIVPDRTRIVVEHRDGGCRVPGCDRRRRTQVHHVVHWEDGGATDTTNLICLCPAHHRMHHLGRLGIEGDADRPDGLEFCDPHGRRLTGHARPAPPRDPTAWPTGTWQPPLGEPLYAKWVQFDPPPSPN